MRPASGIGKKVRNGRSFDSLAWRDLGASPGKVG